jgi:tetratricopeptide (TPR) repeat protein/tRNA A-37 threonylcarbamoyl transferase component Bud32
MGFQIPSSLQPGEVVGRYRVEAVVGEGGMGRVYRAWDISLERRVALKVIRADRASHRAALDRFRREAQILARLDHSGICHVYDWLDHRGTLVMAMEWVDGTLLSELLELGPLPLPQALRVLRETALALAAAHAKGVIHRDLKPSNILITPEGAAKLLDFGLAKDFRDTEPEDDRDTAPMWPGEDATTRTSPVPRQRLTQPGAVMGTRGFIAPELLLGEPATAATDMYALGVTASLILAGDPPPGQDRAAVPWTRRVLQWRSGSGAHPIGPHLLRTLVDRLLSLDPAARPGAQEVVETLDQLQAPASPIWWAAGAAAATLGLAGLGAWAYGRGVIPEFSASHQARLVVVPVRDLARAPGSGPTREVTTTDLLEHALRTFPQVKVVQDRDQGQAPPRLQAAAGEAPEAAEREFIRRVVARTGADLVVVGEVLRPPDPARPALRVRLLDSQGRLRASREVQSRTAEYEPNLAVPSVLQELNRSLSPLGRSPVLPRLPSKETLDTYGLGLDLAQQGDAARALPLLERAALQAPDYAPTLAVYGWTLYTRGDPRALPTLMWARSAAREAGDRYSEAQALINLGLLARRSSRPDEEVSRLEEALALARATEDRDLEARVLDEIGVHHVNRGDRASAERVLQPALQMATAVGNRRLRAHILVNLANVAKYQGRSDEARSLYQQAIAEADILDDPRLEALNRNNLAILDLEEGRLASAEQVLLKVLDLRRDLGDVEGECRVLVNLGIVAFMQGAFDRAAGRYDEALDGARKHDLLLVQGRCLYRIGDLLRAQGKLAPAAARLEESLKLLRTKGTPGNQAEALAALAECRARRSDPAGAEALLEEARRVAGDRPQIWRASAWVHHQRGRPGQALDCLARALEDPQKEDPEHRAEIRALISAWRRRP